MSLLQHLSTPLSSSAFLAHSNFNARTKNVSLQPKRNSICKCIAAVPKEFQTAYMTNVSHNGNLAKLQAGYLFPELYNAFAPIFYYYTLTVYRLSKNSIHPTVIDLTIGRRAAHLLKYPDAQVISLGIGDTTEPIPEVITSAMGKRSQELSTLEGYSNYGAEQGEKSLRAAIASTFYPNLGIEENDIFVSDGAKCDISRLQLVFGADVTMAVQDPSYPVKFSSTKVE